MSGLCLEYGVTREQACAMCHLSSECGGCCARCRAEGRSGTCHGQACSLPSRGHDGQRWETWLFVVAVHQPRLKRFLPRKYWKHVNEIRRKYYGTKQRERGRKEI